MRSWRKSDKCKMYCKRCGYPVHSVRSEACPECGQGFDPADPRTFATNPHWRLRHITNASRTMFGWILLFGSIVGLVFAFTLIAIGFTTGLLLNPSWSGLVLGLLIFSIVIGAISLYMLMHGTRY